MEGIQMNHRQKIFTANTFLAICLLFIVTSSHASDAPYNMPKRIDPSTRYFIYCHNYYVEQFGASGECDYYGILASFSDNGYRVISELRPMGASISDYAKKTAQDVQVLIDAGVPPANIVISGHSKGGVIALQVASQLNNSEIRYVIMAGCGIKPLAKAYPATNTIKGRFLSIYAKKDRIAGSCDLLLKGDEQAMRLKELALDSQKGHRLFFLPEKLWTEPVLAWLNVLND
jgi:hypothetical protein